MQKSWVIHHFIMLCLKFESNFITNSLSHLFMKLLNTKQNRQTSILAILLAEMWFSHKGTADAHSKLKVVNSLN